ncbi:hypothetical protein C8F04DRAFT_1277601 [Mycena alexandri]|uniref:Uncharacterized protein n=1 Tax=Mycena alexandri TaxID=1745969 RepID=A0AAD6WLQ9_9AGAR|nr:hypothetical protein C8F04DRAFT_1201045 [Mycena alexandri]KAJ7018554.1 hypothetical protein C8F04DRAFT_1277601 [Mycena alexandri]
MANLNTYPVAIPSLVARHPALAPLAATFPLLNNSEPANTPLRPAAVHEARLITTVLHASHEVTPNAPVTTTILDEAHTRQTIIETIHGADTHLGGFANVLAIALNAVIAPQITILTATIARNHALQFNALAENYGHPFRGIPKTVPGSGNVLATTVAPGGVPLPPATNSVVNTVCPLLLGSTTATISAFTHAQILVLIEYYNEAFGVVPGDSTAQRRTKILNWVRFGG